jgi:type IX secretion system PorP/SprF family membrane protein
MNRRLSYFLFLLTAANVVQAQDVHFSQYYFSPLSINPAYTGKFAGDYRFFGNYRSQWRDIDRAYNTFSAGGDMNFYPGNLQFSGGLILINDLSSANLGVNKILPSAAWHARLAGINMHFGLQPGVVIKTIDWYKNSFPNQLNWETGAFDHTLPNTESNFSQRFVYADFNVGFAASKRIGKFEPEAGFSAFHLNKPKENFFATHKTALPVRQAVNASLTYSAASSVILQVHSLYGFTTRVTDWVSGIKLEYVLSRTAFYSNSIFAGVMWRDGLRRNPDAGIATIGFGHGPLTLGLSFDITMSQLRTSVDSRGAYEIAVIYRGRDTRLQTKVVPCERY